MKSIELAHALDGLYEAAATPEGWSDALHRFAQATGSVGCTFYPRHPELTDLRFPASPDDGELLTDFFSNGWWRIDHRASRGWPLAESGRSVILEHDIASDDERRHSPYYRELLKRHDLPWWAAITFTVDSRLWCVPIHRSARQGPFMPAEARDLAEAAAGLRRVVSLAGKLTLAHARGAVEALERAGCAALVLDDRGGCLLINTLAERVVGGDLVMARGHLRAVDRAGDPQLQDLISRAIAPQAAGSPGPNPVFVRRREGRPYMVEAFPAKGPMRDVFRRIAALIVITDLNARAKPADALLREAFGLTPAEGRLASILAAGEDLRHAADTLGVAYETARAQLKAIFGKAQVSRQSEFMALMARIAVQKKTVT